MNIIDLEFCKNNKVAFEFHSFEEHQQLLDFFGLKNRKTYSEGTCSLFFNEESYPTSYTCAHSLSVVSLGARWYEKHGYIILQIAAIEVDKLSCEINIIKKEIYGA